MVESAGIYPLAAVAAVALLLSLLLLLHHWEFRRWFGSRLSEYERLTDWDTRHVALIVPVKGPDFELEENLAALFELDHPNYEIVFVVESAQDPAAPIIQRLISTSTKVPARLLIAGLADVSGQKVHNLLAATEDLPQRVEALAFVDADARPRAAWLKLLMYRTDREANGAITGYRWLIPQSVTLPNLLLYSVNSGVTALLGKHRFNLIWGGSWAMRREVFESSSMRDQWQGTLSDDLVASRAVQQAGLRVEFEPGCLCPSPIDVGWGQVIEFLRRQFLISRRYSPLHWWLGVLYVTVLQVGFWGSGIAGLALWAAGRVEWPVFTAVCGLMYATGACRAWLRQDAARICLPQFGRQLARVRWFDILAAPLAGLLGWLLMLSSSVGSCIEWRGNRYRILSGGQIQLTSRQPDLRIADTDGADDEWTSHEGHRRAA